MSLWMSVCMVSCSGLACMRMKTDIGQYLYVQYIALNLPLFMVFLPLSTDGLSVGQMHNESELFCFLSATLQLVWKLALWRTPVTITHCRSSYWTLSLRYVKHLTVMQHSRVLFISSFTIALLYSAGWFYCWLFFFFFFLDLLVVWFCSSRSHFSLAGLCCSDSALMTVVWKLSQRQTYELGSGPVSATAKCSPCFY